MPATRVVVADDDPVFTAALVAVLEADPRFVVVGTAATGEELAGMVPEQLPGLVLLDVRMPGGGAEAAARLTASAMHPVVVAVSAQQGVSAILAMLRAGAVGYLAKGGMGAALPDLLARAMAGEVVLAATGGHEALRQLLAFSSARTAPDVP